MVKQKGKKEKEEKRGKEEKKIKTYEDKSSEY